MSTIILPYKRTLFYTAFVLSYCIGGFIHYFGIFPLKLAYIAFIPFLFLPFYRIRQTRMLIFSVVFGIYILFSALLNQSSILKTLLFLQNAIIPFMMYYLCKHYLKPHNIKLVIKIAVLVAIIQLPIIIFQKLFYNQINALSAVLVNRIDIGFGTFYTSNDPSVAFFMLSIVLFILFQRQRSAFIPYRNLVAIWLSISILGLNSKLSILCLLLVWGVYIVLHLSFKRILFLIVSMVTVVVMLFATGISRQISDNVGNVRERILINIPYYKAKFYFEHGMGNRMAAWIYLSSQPISIVGEGPYYSFDPITKEYHVGGNTGQLQNYYIDLGIIGLIFSYFFMYINYRAYPRSLFTSVYLLILILFTITVNVFTDPSILLIFNIFLSYSLIQYKTLE